MVLDNENLITDLRETFDKFITTVSTFDELILNQPPHYGGWTAGQVADHIVKGTIGLPDGQTQEPAREADCFVQHLKELFLNFDLKMESPDFIYPEKGPFSIRQLITALEVNKQQYIESIEAQDSKALCLDFEFPTFGFLTRYEWLMFTQFHIQRHTHQLRQIFKAHTRNTR